MFFLNVFGYRKFDGMIPRLQNFNLNVNFEATA